MEIRDKIVLKNETGGPCPICLESLLHRRTKILSCGHSFHVSCILRWTKKKAQCPCCRRVVKSADSPEPEDLMSIPIRNLIPDFEAVWDELIAAYADLPDEDAL